MAFALIQIQSPINLKLNLQSLHQASPSIKTTTTINPTQQPTPTMDQLNNLKQKINNHKVPTSLTASLSSTADASTANQVTSPTETEDAKELSSVASKWMHLNKIASNALLATL